MDQYERWSQRREIAAWYAAAQAWSEPSTKLKYTEDPADAPNGKFDRSYGRTGGTAFTGFKAFGETPMERLPYFNSEGQLFLAGGRGTDSVMLLLHSRTTSAGLTRLIAIDRPSFDGNLLRLNVSQIGPLNGDYRILRGGATEVDMTGIAGPGEIRLYAGQPGLQNRSRFSIPFEARGRRGYIDGVFKPGSSSSPDPENARIEQEANSTIAFSIRTEATTQPSP